MRIQFKQRVQFQKKPYGPGEVELDVSQLAPHEKKFLHKMIDCGLALEPKGKPVEDISEAERQKRLGERLLKEGETKQPQGPIDSTTSLPDNAQGASSEDEESSEGESESDESEESEGEGEESSSEAEEPSEDEEPAKPGKKKKGKKKR